MVCSFQTWTCFFNWQFFAALKVISTFFGRCWNGQFQKNVALPEGTSFILFHHIYVMQKSNSWKEHKSNKYFCAFFCKYNTHLMHLRSIIDQCTRSLLAYKVDHFFHFIIWKKNILATNDQRRLVIIGKEKVSFQLVLRQKPQ